MRVLGALLVGVVLLSGCQGSKEPVHVSGQIAGAHYAITIDSPGGITAEAVRARIATIVSDTGAPSYADNLAALNKASDNQWVAVSPQLAALVAEALRVGRATSGAVDVTDGSIRAVWGIADTGRPTKVPTTGELSAARDESGLGLLDARDDPAALKKKGPGMRLALAGLGRSDMVDRIGDLLSDMGADSYLVSLQGSVLAHGRKADDRPWQVGLERPTGDARQVAGIVGLDDAAMATAGHSDRFIDIGDYRVSPELDPRTGRPVPHPGLSVTVVADSTLHAALLARALLVMGPGVGLQYAKDHHIAAFFFSAGGRDGSALETAQSPSFAPVLEAR